MILRRLLAFYRAFSNVHRSGVLTTLFSCYMAGATWNCCRLGAFCAHHTYSHTLCHVTSYKNTKLPTYLLIQNHIRRVHVCLAVTCHLHFWQNDRDLLRATAVTREWNEYEIRVSTECWPWRIKCSCRSCRDSNPRLFDHVSGTLSIDLSSIPKYARIL